MGLKHRIIGSILLVVAAGGAAGGYAYFEAAQTTVRADLSEKSVIVADAARDYLQTLGNLRSAVLRYASTNTDADRAALVQAIKSVTIDVRHLETLVQGEEMERVAAGSREIAAIITDALDRLKVKRESLEAVLLGLSAIGENLVKLQGLLQPLGGDGAALALTLGEHTLSLLADGARFGLTGAPADIDRARAALGRVRDALESAKSIASAAAVPRAEREPIRYFGRDLDLFRDGLAQYEAASLGYGETLRRLDGLLSDSIDIATRVVGQERTASITLAADLRDAADQSQRLILAASAAALLIGLAVAAAMAANILRPFERLRASLEAIGRGDLQVAVTDANRRDEIGGMARTLLTVRESLAEAAGLRAARDEHERKLAAERRAAITQMASTVEGGASEAVGVVAQHSRHLSAEADRMLEAATRMSDAASIIKQASDQSSAGSQNAATATEELSATARDIARQVADSSERIQAAARRGETARDIMEQLAGSIARVEDIAAMIDRIASQTNLLALNATIEAARAGDAGKGFTVVATEVKKLAGQTAASTEDIRRIVQEIGGLGGRCVEVVVGMGQEVSRIDAIAGSIAASVEEQHAATREIARIVSDAAVSVGQVSAMIEKIAADAGMTGEMASVVRSLSGEMARRVDVMNADIVGAVRRAAAA